MKSRNKQQLVFFLRKKHVAFLPIRFKKFNLLEPNKISTGCLSLRNTENSRYSCSLEKKNYLHHGP